MVKKFHITTGDIDGIGLEISLKALLNVNSKLDDVQFFIWCHDSQKSIIDLFLQKSPELKITSSFLNKFNETLFNTSKTKFNFIMNKEDKPSLWFVESIQDCIRNKSAVITAPISKPQIIKDGLKDIGHTQILKRYTKIDKLKMAFVGSFFNVILFSDHIPVNHIKVDQSDFMDFLKLAKSFHSDLGLNENISLLGLNPHAGDLGLIGTEDEEIKSWVLEDQKNIDSVTINLPIAADSAFVGFQNKKPTTYLSLYHDQGLIPFKMAHGFSGFHCTLGLPFVRTSVDHGTAKEIFGKNCADSRSMSDAILGAYMLSKKNKET